MALATRTAQQQHYSPQHHNQQQQQQQVQIQMQRKTAAASGDLKRTVNMYVSKLSDRDTEAMAATELESLARSLQPDSLPSFLSAITDTRPSDKTPLRRHCVRLLSLLSQSHSPQSLGPLLPRMLAAVVRRLRDPDSSVRSACVDAVRSMSASANSFSVFLRPLSESLLLEQDHNAQMGSAMCLAAAIEGTDPLDLDQAAQMQRLLPRLAKLLRSDAFKAKPSLLSLLGTIVAAGGASTPSALGILVPCLIDFLASEDWAARKAAAEALSRVASISDAHLLSSFKSTCISSYESRRFDKVKIVRDSMNQMLEAWKDLPSSLSDGGTNNAAGINSQSNSSAREIASVKSDTRQIARKNKSPPLSRSPPPEASPTPASRRNSFPISEKRRTSPPLFRKLDHKKPSDWKVEMHTSKALHENKQGETENNTRFQMESRRVLFENDSEEKANKFNAMKTGARVVPIHEKESNGSTFGTATAADLYSNQKENNDLFLIRKQLVQIENQQSSLLEILQKFIGSSQNGLRSLETRVHGLEMALDDISRNLATSTERMRNTDSSANTCCKLPGSDFLSSMFSRRTEGRYSSRYSLPSNTALAGIRNSADKESVESVQWDKRQFGIQGGFVVNPLAELHLQPRQTSDGSSGRLTKSVVPDSGCSSAQNGKRSHS